ncbi:MAG: T9SS type A sorting domain-containing protein [Bacteroidia bacterium]|nr:T9SS type A sorting domain-containing protein [Bacteroidia bacterium]
MALSTSYNVAPGTPSTPTAGTIVQPTCTVPTGSVTINGLPSSGNWSLGISPGNISVTGTGTSSTITSLAPATYTFAVTNDAGCTSLPLSGVVTQAVPIGYIPVIEKKWNSVLVCYNLNNEFTSWQWYRGNDLVSTVNTKAYYNTNKIAGSYRVYATDKDGCKNYSNNIDIWAGSKGVILYPNPAADMITLSISDESTGKTVISFYNSSGIKVLEDQTDKPDEVLVREIQVKHLEHGIYTIKITVNQKDISHNRLVISR